MRRKRRPVKDTGLNITSLMDVLTILLIFLIQSFSSQEDEFTPPKDFALPQSLSERQVEMAVKVSIGVSEVRVEDQSVVPVDAGAIPAARVDAQKLITPLLAELKKQKAKVDAGAVKVGKDEETDVVFLEAAKGTPYALVNQVLKTSAAAGFTKFRLAVNKI